MLLSYVFTNHMYFIRSLNLALAIILEIVPFFFSITISLVRLHKYANMSNWNLYVIVVVYNVDEGIDIHQARTLKSLAFWRELDKFICSGSRLAYFFSTTIILCSRFNCRWLGWRIFRVKFRLIRSALYSGRKLLETCCGTSFSEWFIAKYVYFELKRQLLSLVQKFLQSYLSGVSLCGPYKFCFSP